MTKTQLQNYIKNNYEGIFEVELSENGIIIKNRDSEYELIDIFFEILDEINEIFPDGYNLYKIDESAFELTPR